MHQSYTHCIVYIIMHITMYRLAAAHTTVRREFGSSWGRAALGRKVAYARWPPLFHSDLPLARPGP